MTYLYPRLSAGTARRRLTELEKVAEASANAVAQTVATEHDGAFYAPTGGQRVPPERLQHLRREVLAIAHDFGYPMSEVRGATAGQEFDRSVAPRVRACADMAPAEAEVPGVWNMLSTVLLPDVTLWRWGFGNKERWIASDLTRHAWARLWWRAELLGPAPDDEGPGLLERLQEQDLNQLLERTRLAGDARLVRALATAYLDTLQRPEAEHVNRRVLIRDAGTRVLRMTGWLDPHSLDDAALDALMRSAVADSLSLALVSADEAPTDASGGPQMDLVTPPRPARVTVEFDTQSAEVPADIPAHTESPDGTVLAPPRPPEQPAEAEPVTLAVAPASVAVATEAAPLDVSPQDSTLSTPAPRPVDPVTSAIETHLRREGSLALSTLSLRLIPQFPELTQEDIHQRLSGPQFVKVGLLKVKWKLKR